MAATTYLFARADWDASKIADGDIAPFIDVTGLTFGVNAFNSANAVIQKANLLSDATALFATCGDNESYGNMLSCNGARGITISTVNNGGNSAHFGRLYVEGAYAAVFDSATVDFKKTDTSTDPVFFVASTNASVKIQNGSTITISPNGENETLVNIAGSFILSNSSFKVIGDTSAALSSATMEIKDGATFEAGSFKDTGHPITISGIGTEFTVNGDFDNFGELSVTNGAKVSANTFENEGTHTVTINGSTFNVSGNFDNGGALSVTNSTFTVNGSLLNEGAHTIAISGGAFSVTGLLDNAGPFSATNGATISAGSFKSSGTPVTISGEGTSFTTKSLNMTSGIVNIESGATVDVTDVTGTTVNGTLNISGEGTSFTTDSLDMTSGIVNIESGATVDVTNDKNTGSISINGTLNISGEGTHFNTDSLVNGGTVSVTNGADVSGGTVTIGNFKTISIVDSTFSANSITMAGGAMITINSSSLITAGSLNDSSGLWIKNNKIEVTGSSSSFGCERIISLSGGSASEIPIVIAEGSGLHLYTNMTTDGAYEYWVSSAETVFVNTDWTDSVYTQGADIANEGGKYYRVNAFNGKDSNNNDLNYAAGVAAGSSANLVIEKGTFTDIIELQGVNTTVQKGVGDIKFTKAVCGGTKAVATGGSVSASNVITIEAGTFEKFIVGGSNIHLSNSSDNYALTGANVDPETGRKFAHMLEISGGIFGSSTTGIVAAGDRFERGQFTVNGDINTYISGGTFNYRLAGGLLNSTGSVTDGAGKAIVNGNVNLTISGGTFAAGSWIYGGCISSFKASTYSTMTEIDGNVTVKVDSTENQIRLGTLVVGSYGWGKITGNAKLVLTGDGANLTFNDNTEIWGGCSGDDLDPISGKVENSSVTGKRILSFTGFNGELNCKKIRAFDTIECSGSAVSLKDGGTYGFSGVKNWEFTYGKKTDETQADFTGNFENDFTGDTLDLYLGAWDESNSWTILDNARDGAYTGFGDDSFSVKYATASGALTAMNWNEGGYYYHSADTGYEYRLGLNETRMEFTKVSTSTIA